MYCRCQSQGNNTFDQFIQWGVGLLKKTLGPGQPRRPREEAALWPRTELEEQRLVTEEPAPPEEPAASLEEKAEPLVPAETEMTELEVRAAAYWHMAISGEEITEDWPPPGTPTWSEWLEVTCDISCCGDTKA